MKERSPGWLALRLRKRWAECLALEAAEVRWARCSAPPGWAGRQRSARPLPRLAEEAMLEAVERPEDEGMLLQEVLPHPQLPLWASLDRWPL